MRTLFCTLILIVFTAQVNAHEKAKNVKYSHHGHSHREHGAHQHGVGQAGLAFEGAVGKFEFKAPAESIIGFEHEAKKEKDIKKRDEALALFESKISEMLVFDSALNCKFKKEKVEIQHEAASADKKSNKKHTAHSDFLAQYSVVCDKSPAGTTIALNFHSQFKRLKKIEFQLIADNLQKSIEVNKSSTKLELK